MKPAGRELVLEVALFSMATALVSLFYRENILLALLLLFAWVFALRF